MNDRDIHYYGYVVERCRDACCDQLRLPCPLTPPGRRESLEKCVEDCVAASESGEES
ncbi:MAG: hypothetical protein ACP5NY_04205 [Thermocladium sp.]